MGQTTIRIPDDLLDEIDETTEPEETRSEWIRDACRERLTDDDHDDLDDRVNALESRVVDLEREQGGGLFGGLFG